MSVFHADNFSHWMNVAQKLSASDMIPKGYKGKPMDILLSIEMGQQVGLGMMQALQSIAVINGMPSMYGDAPLAVCQSHPSFEYIKEEAILKGNDVQGYRCTVKRRNNDEHTVIFTVDDAKKANLWGKQGPWSQYPSRMLQMRARGFALRNTFPDALKGIHIAEEVQDHQIIDATYTPKLTQEQKRQALLTKKGFNNEKTAIDSEINSDVYNSSSAIEDSGDNITNFIPSPQVNQAETCLSMAEDGESKDHVNAKKNVVSPCTPEQLDAIECLIDEKSLDKARHLKALDHFNVTSFAELTSDQATKMIKMLNKLE